MEKEFNITGTCISEMHYMVDVSKKLYEVIELINKRKYFTINRSRQYGKTTTLYMLERYLNEKEGYLIIFISFEGIGDSIFENEKVFSKGFIEIVCDTLFLEYEDLAKFLMEQKDNINDLKTLSRIISKFIMKVNKKVILMIDEVDKSSNNQLFLSFLGMLRNKYLLRNMGKDYTFHTVILAGLHDVKTLKIKLRPNEEKKYNSPWNIATEFKVDMSFKAEEIATMLLQYEEYNNKGMDIEGISEEIYKNTSGYPFLVSKICKLIDEELEKDFTLEGIQKAIKIILIESNTLFDDLIKNLENNSQLYKLVYNILIYGKQIEYNIDNPIVNIGIIYGILDKNKQNKIKIHNKIFETRIYNYMISKMQTSDETIVNYETESQFIDKENDLNIEKVLTKFQELMIQEYREEDGKFLERQGRLLFLSFVKPIINGVGFYFVEPQTRTNKRMDIVITYNKKKYIIELKLWKGQSYEEKAVHQLVDYMNIHDENKGYLLVFNFNKNKEYKSEWIRECDKDIFEVIV